MFPLSRNLNRKLRVILLVAIITIQECTVTINSYPHRNKLEKLSQTPAEDRKFLKPPTFPYWGPFGLTSTALFCAFYVGPFAGSWNRACAGPVPPFQKAANITTTTPKPSNGTYYGYQSQPTPFPGPYPPPKDLSFPYDNGFYPLPGNVLALNVPGGVGLNF